MCGIVCYVGKSVPLVSVAEQLKKLEYRGYDSSGMAFICGGKLKVEKSVGRIDNLVKLIENKKASVVISHTRWATHGAVTKINAHPQLSPKGQFAVVHNGIIENYAQLKEKLGKNNFVSQTDTEVVAHLLEKASGTTLERLQTATKKLVGSYALGVLHVGEDKVFIAKNKSPLYVGKRNDAYFAASDISCFGEGEYYELPDGCMAELTATEAIFYLNGNKIELPVQVCDADFSGVQKNGYAHFMQKEIAETPSVISNIYNYYSNNIGLLENVFTDTKNIVFVGCGTAYHACMLGAEWARKNLKISTSAQIASEYRYSEPDIDAQTAVVLVSQSGETADTLAVGELAKSKGAKVYAITNVEYSAITKLSSRTFPLRAGYEIAVASTKAYCAMLAILYLLTISAPASKKLEVLKNLPLTELAAKPIPQNIVEQVKNSRRVFFIGRQDDGVTAYEGALKLKEIAYMDACGYYAGELKHGTIALVEPNTTLIAILTDETLAAKTLSGVEEVQSRGANVILVTNKPNMPYNCLKIPQIADKQLSSLLAVLPLQQLAYQVSISLGWDPDHPRNLAKSVTVE